MTWFLLTTPPPTFARLRQVLGGGTRPVHYLVIFRFFNTFLKPIRNRNYLQSVQITMAEAFGVAGRGCFYHEPGSWGPAAARVFRTCW